MIPVVPGATSVKFHLIINDTTGTFLMGNWTASGATLAYNIGESATWTKVTIGQGTEGTWSSGTICDSATSSSSPVLGEIQICVPDASVPSALGQRVQFKLDNGTASGSRAMFPLPFTLIGSNVHYAAADTNSHYLVNAVAVNYSTAAATNLALVTNDSNNFMKVSPQINGVTLNCFALGITGTANLTSVIIQAGSITLNGGMTTQGLTVTAALNVGSLLVAAGTVTLNGGMTTQGLTVTTGLNVGNFVVAAGTVTLNGAVTFGALTLTNGGTLNLLGGTLASVTTLTNLPAITAGWLTATGIAANALNGKGDWLVSTSYPTNFSIMVIDSNGRLDISAVSGEFQSPVNLAQNVSRIAVAGATVQMLMGRTNVVNAYYVIMNGSGQVYNNGSAIFQTIDPANWNSQYKRTLTQPIISGGGPFPVILFKNATFPAIPPGRYFLIGFTSQTTPAYPDVPVATLGVRWDGTSLSADVLPNMLTGDSDSAFTAAALVNAPSGGLTAQQVANALKLAPSAGSPAAGSVYDDLNTIITSIAGFTFSGAYTRGFHVQDTATNSIQSAIVRIQLNTDAEYHVTPASGNFTTSLDAHTYTLTATCPGYAGYANTLTVSADGAFTIVMTALVPPVPADPNDCTLYFYTVNQAGAIATGTVVAWELSNPDDDTVVANGTSSSNAVTALWSLDVRIPASGTTYLRITTPTRTFDAALPYTTTPGSSLKIAGP